MELKITKTQNGTHGLPSSIERNVEVASYEHYEQMNIRSFESMYQHRNDIATLREISKFRKDGNAVIASIFARSMDKVKVLTGVKNWIGLEGVKFFMDEVMHRYAKNDPFEIQLTPVDIQIFSNKIIKGEYGELYENISVPKILGWLEEYVNERVEFSMANKKRKESKKHRDEESEINPEGLLRQAEAHGKIHRKYISERPKRIVRYKSMDDYIDRNDLDPNEFRKATDLEYEAWCVGVESSSDLGMKIRDQNPEIIAAYRRIFELNWIAKQNEKLKQKH